MPAQLQPEWRFWLREDRGALGSAAMFVVIFALYIGQHHAGCTPSSRR